MKKPLKIVAWIIGGLLLLIVAAAVALPMLFDPNDYRSKASEYVKTEYGRRLEKLIGEVKGGLRKSAPSPAAQTATPS